MIYLDNNRKNVNGSQRESSRCVVDVKSKMINFDGYQNFTIFEDSVVSQSKKIKEQLNILNKIDYSDSNSIIDIGCSNGFFAFWYLFEFPTKQVTFMDHDEECIKNIKNTLNILNFSNYDIVKDNFSGLLTQNKSYDTILMLSIIHWLYSCTTEIGCLHTIIKNIRNINNKQLIIEWVETNDVAIQSFKHISFNEQVHKSAYTLDVFLSALKSNYTNVKFLSFTNGEKTRSIYLCAA